MLFVLQDIDVKTGQDDDESANTSGSQESAEDAAGEDECGCPATIANGHEDVVGSDAKEEIVILSQDPAEYEPETNNNDCTFYKQSLAKQALAGVF